MARLVCLTVVLLALLGLPAPPAAAEMEVAMQDDLTIVYGYRDRDLALRQFKRMGGTTVRITVEHSREKRDRNDVRATTTVTPFERYTDAIRAITDHGLDVQVTLVYKYVQSPARLAEWMGRVARRLGPDVKRFSILNEPDLLLEAGCGPRSRRRFARQFPTRVKQGPVRLRARVKSLRGTMNLKVACLRYKRGRIYRRIVSAAERSIRAERKRAEVLAGETSAQPGLDWFARGARPREMQVDGWAHHPFQLNDLTPRIPSTKWGIGSLPLLKRTLGVPIYLTEFGYPHPRSRFAKKAFGRRLKPRETARVLPIAWRLARKAGARQMLQYQWYVKPRWRTEIWETALLNRDNGRVTPAYRALKRLIASW